MLKIFSAPHFEAQKHYLRKRVSSLPYADKKALWSHKKMKPAGLRGICPCELRLTFK